MPTIADSFGSWTEAVTTTSSWAAATTSPIRPYTRSSTCGPNQCGRDRLVPARHPELFAEHFLPDGQHIGLGARHGVHMTGPALAAEQGNARAQLPVLVEVDPGLLVERNVDHAVVRGDVQGGAGWQLFGEALHETVHIHQLAAPGVGVDAEAVPLAVDLAVVRVDERPVTGGEPVRGQVHPLLAGEPAVERATAQRDLGERSVLEGRG